MPAAQPGVSGASDVILLSQGAMSGRGGERVRRDTEEAGSAAGRASAGVNRAWRVRRRRR